MTRVVASGTDFYRSILVRPDGSMYSGPYGPYNEVRYAKSIATSRKRYLNMPLETRIEKLEAVHELVPGNAIDGIVISAMVPALKWVEYTP